MSLVTHQTLFTRALSPECDPVTADAAARAVRKAGTLSGAERLAIYRSTVTTAHVNALRQIYPVCEQVLGERVFARCAREYTWNAPSTSPDLNVYGKEFPALLAEKTDRLRGFHEFAYLHDLALLEWHCHAACYQPDDGVFDFDTFAEVSSKPERLVFSLNHSLAIMKTDYPVVNIRERHRSKADTATVAGLTETDYLCIHRAGYEPVISHLDVSAWELLQAIIAQHSLADLGAEAVFQKGMGELPEMIQRGWVTGFRLTPTRTVGA